LLRFSERVEARSQTLRREIFLAVWNDIRRLKVCNKADAYMYFLHHIQLKANRWISQRQPQDKKEKKKAGRSTIIEKKKISIHINI